MDTRIPPLTAEQVYELWTVNYDIARVAMTKRAGVSGTELKRLNTKAGRLADEQTKRQIRDAEAWQRFTNQRARSSRQSRPGGKLPNPFKGPSARSARRAYSVRKSDAV